MDRNTGGIMNQYWLWREKAVADQELGEELKGMEQEPDRIREAFYRELVFGTGGLRNQPDECVYGGESDPGTGGSYQKEIRTERMLRGCQL